MMKHWSKKWIIGYLILVIGTLSLAGYSVVKVDPFFHYHKPNTDRYYYYLDNPRSQNDGIIKHFEYDAIIIGTSMTENFKTTEMDALFGTHSIKVPYPGASYKEINDNLVNALEHNPNLRVIVRGLDMNKFIEDKDAMRLDLGVYPTYLYDDVLYNDVKYIFNWDVIVKKVFPMIHQAAVGGQPGITSFDAYSNYMSGYRFGINTVYPNGMIAPKNGEAVHLSDDEKAMLLENVHQNVTSLAEKYPDVTFFYFFPPYSIGWWRNLVDDGTVYRQIEAEQLVIEEILKFDNIKLYSFNDQIDLISDMNNYRDEIHYGEWINSLMLCYMKGGKCLLTTQNYMDYLTGELVFYTEYDYSQLNDQIDYENDYYIWKKE